MQQRKLGRTDLRVSELCLDTTGFGWNLDGREAAGVLDAFHAARGNFIHFHSRAESDAADPAAAGVAEAIVGRWFHERGVPRSDYVLASCVQLTVPPTGWSYFRIAAALREHCERVLQRLQSPYLDLLFLQWSDPLPVDETLVAVESLLRAGLFRHLGCSGFPAWRTMEWNGHAARRQLGRLATAQIDVPFAHDLGSWRECFDLARQHCLGLVVRPPLQAPAAVGPAPAVGPRPVAARDATSAALLRVARERGVPPQQVALAWVLADPATSAALVAADAPTAPELFRTVDTLELAFHEVLRISRPERFGLVSDIFNHAGPASSPEAASALPPANGYALSTSLPSLS